MTRDFWRRLSLLCFLTCCSLATGQSRIDCSAFNSRVLNRAVRYCVYLPSGYDAGASEHPARRYPVLYFLHGLGDNEQTLFNTGGWTLLDDLRSQHQMGDFLIVAPEGRRSFYINSSDGSVRYSDFFLQEFLPLVERKYRVRAGHGGRAISGISMGGYGALRFAFARPDLFSSVSAQSAALITESPRQLDAASQTGAPLAGVLAPVFGRPIDPHHWDKNNPFILARENAGPLRKLAIYFNCGQDDNYGFEKGAAQLHDELQKEGVKHEYHLYPGDHSLTYFLAHFAEVMEFHSREFGLLPMEKAPTKRNAAHNQPR
jgi:S-formylglutathione hydrolase FrmB